ncbi:MAG: pseudouridine synthase [Acholeplasmataceae bacterium]|nr:pseudouridine synthase [Acholeplasmataceae bacterium]
MRIDKFLSNLKYGSRKEIKQLLRAHEVKINLKRVIDPATSIDPNKELVFIDGEQVFYKESIDIMIYKPVGYLSANHDSMHSVITSLIQAPYDRFDFSIAGRLDLDAEGLLILTTDGNFAHHIMHPKKHIEKTYEVMLDKPFVHHQALLNGIFVKDGYNDEYFAKAIAIKKNKEYVTIIIDEGKFHQVKRMFQAVGYEVLRLKRTRIGNLELKDLKPGEYKEFERKDLE